MAPIIPRHFSRLQVAAIVTFIIMTFYLFRKDINAYFDQADSYSSANPQLGIWAIIIFMTMAFGFLTILGGWIVYNFKIEPKRYQKKNALIWRGRLEDWRPKMNALDYTMESSSIMFQTAAEKRIYLLGYGHDE
jgi:hypothetical protein